VVWFLRNSTAARISMQRHTSSKSQLYRRYKFKLDFRRMCSCWECVPFESHCRGAHYSAQVQIQIGFQLQKSALQTVQIQIWFQENVCLIWSCTVYSDEFLRMCSFWECVPFENVFLLRMCSFWKSLPRRAMHCTGTNSNWISGECVPNLKLYCP